MIEFLIFVIIILLIGVGVLGYMVFNLLRKYEDAEDKYNVSEKNREELELWITTFSNKIDEIHTTITTLDKRGSFEADDEVGFFFKTIKNIAEELKMFN